MATKNTKNTARAQASKKAGPTFWQRAKDATHGAATSTTAKVAGGTVVGVVAVGGLAGALAAIAESTYEMLSFD